MNFSMYNTLIRNTHRFIVAFFALPIKFYTLDMHATFNVIINARDPGKYTSLNISSDESRDETPGFDWCLK